MLLNGAGGEEIAIHIQDALYANGLVEFREQFGTVANPGGGIDPKRGLFSPSDVCDFYVPLVCKLKRISGRHFLRWGG